MPEPPAPTPSAVTYVRNPELAHRELDGETVMLSPETGAYYGLDRVGTRIWQLLRRACTVEQLCDQLLQEFEVERPQCEADVSELLAQLLEEGLVLRQ